MKYRIGIGYDIHRLVDGRKLFIGGVQIPYKKGLLGHSDGDVLLHAICDALLGAASNTDIGEMFPDNDPTYQRISSIKLLKKVDDLLKKKGFLINNIDTVVIAEEPRLRHFKKRIRKKITQILNVRQGNVNMKTKTNEGLDDLGRKAAIAAYAAVIITKGE